MTYRISNEALPLAHLRSDLDTVGRDAHPSMRDQAIDAARVRNRIIDLLLGVGEFADAWSQPEMVLGEDGEPTDVQAGYDPGTAAPLVDAVCFEIRATQSPNSPLNADSMREMLGRLPADHPLVANWAVVRDACYIYGQTRVDWDELVPG